MIDGSMMGLMYLVVCLLIMLACGMGASVAGGSFWWGFLFGPVGIVVAAIIAQGNQLRAALIRSAPSGSTARPATALICKHCGTPLKRRPDWHAGTIVECPNCGGDVVVN